MSSLTSGRDDDAPDLVCQLDCVGGMVDALSSVRWKRHQDTVLELWEHGIVLILESSCLQAKVYLKRELFVQYDYAAAEGWPRFGLSLGLLSLLQIDPLLKDLY